ncbi:MAG: hypothetical protein WBG01_15565, partial [Bacteroidota bacterium]
MKQLCSGPPLLLLASVLLWSTIPGCSSSEDEENGTEDSRMSAAAASFVGRSRCAECHKREHDLWQGS